MNYGIISCIPLTVVIIGACLTKRITESFIAGSVIASILVYKTSFLTGYAEMLYSALSNPSFQLLMIVVVGFGGIIALIERSGGLLGFQKIMVKLCKTSRSTMVLVWLLGGIVFIDDYLNALAVSATMKGISDQHRIPREHLAYTVNCMGACVCVLIPFSSWSAFAIGNLGEYGLKASVYYNAIPFMFYPICSIMICFLLALRKFPLIGSIKSAYERVESGGSVLCGKSEDETSHNDDYPIEQSSLMNFVIPMVALMVGMLLFDNDIVHGIFIAIAVICVMYTYQKLMTVTDITDTFLKGAASMAPLLFNITIAFAMQAANEQMGFTSYIIEAFTKNINTALLPVIAFLIVGFLAFAAASFWALIVISFPVFINLAIASGVNPSLVVAAVMSGVALGSQGCLYSDAIFMVSAGTGVSNVTQFKTAINYVIPGAVMASMLFLVAGIIFK